MLFRGGGVGHAALREKLKALFKDAEKARVEAESHQDEPLLDAAQEDDERGPEGEYDSDEDEDSVRRRTEIEEEDAGWSSEDDDGTVEVYDPRSLRDSDDEEDEGELDDQMFEESGIGAF